MENTFKEENLKEFVRNQNLHRWLPVGSPKAIADDIDRNETAVRGVSKGEWTDLDILEAIADKLIDAGKLGRELKRRVQSERSAVAA